MISPYTDFNLYFSNLKLGVNAGLPYEPFLFEAPPEQRAIRWAIGFLLGLGLREGLWTPLLRHRKMGQLAVAIYALAADGTEQTMELLDATTRKNFIEALPALLLSIVRFWKTPAQQPAPVRKAGRNDPCPCGSGRKYKKCCSTGGTTVN